MYENKGVDGNIMTFDLLQKKIVQSNYDQQIPEN